MWKKIDRIWYGHSVWRFILWPISMLFRCIVTVRRLCYRYQFLRSAQLPVPVIVVGNISVGGTGKTPFCVTLCQYLQQTGWQPGLVSRGYGGKAVVWPQTVTPQSDPELVGDEPVLLAQRTGCPMVVAPDRVAAAKQLLQESGCNIIISDDGLQHYALNRDVEIVMQDAQREWGNGLCLPAGPLREPLARLKSVDIVVRTGLDMTLRPQLIRSVLHPAQLAQVAAFSDQRVVAMAGIGNPQRFFNTLSAMGLLFGQSVWPDHHFFSAADIASIEGDVILMTEKDAVKCRSIADSRCYYVPVEGVLNQAILQQLDQIISLRLTATGATG